MAGDLGSGAGRPSSYGGRGGGRGGRGGGQGPMADAGVYGVVVSIGGQEFRHTLEILEDVWMNQR